METKSCELSIKAVSEGKVVATLARIGVRDRDGDVLKSGLLHGEQLVAIKPQHKWDHVNLGVARVYEKSGTMEASLEFNMQIQSAKDWFEAVRFSHERHHRQEYSFGFAVVDSEQGQHEDGKAARFLKQISIAEVSPVLIGASIGSQTLSVKEQENGGMAEPEVPVVESVPDTPQEPLGDETLPSVEDYKNFPEDRRPPLSTMITWIRLYRYHMPFLQDIRKRDHREMSPEIIRDFKTLIEECIEVASQLGIALLNADRMPTAEEQERQKQQHAARFYELTAHVKEQADLAYQQLQAQAEELARAARVRSARMKELHL